jgi:L-fuculose-phosphate aldolase
MNEDGARRELTAVCTRLYERRLTVSAGGNMSVRLGGDRMLITPTGRNKGALSPEDMVLMDLDGGILSAGRPSIEHRFHIGLYRADPEINAIVHCHPLNCVALAVRGEPLRTGLTPEGVLLLGEVPMIGYHTPGSQELVDEVVAHADSAAMLMLRHGALTRGRTLEEAYNRMEELEFQAELQMLVGDAGDLPADEIARIRGL